MPNRYAGPYIQQWHIDLQHEVAKDTIATVSSKGTHLVWQRDINQLFPVTSSQNPFHAGQPLTTAICSTVTGAWTQNVSGVVNGTVVSSG